MKQVKDDKFRLDPGFWIGLILIAGLLFCTIKCR